MIDAPCAKGGRVRDLLNDEPGAAARHLCPRVEHAPQSREGQIILSLVASGAILKTGFGGVEGIDRAEARARLADTQPPIAPWVAAELLDYAEDGVLKGVAARRARKGDDD